MVCIILLGLFLPLTVSAVDLRGDSRTFLGAREGADDDEFIPLHEYLDFYADDFAEGDLTFHFGGWLRQDLADKSFDNKKFNSDLQYAYLSVRESRGNLLLNLGRVLVFEGVASEQVDGLYGRMDLDSGLDVSLYGGIPVEADFDSRGGDVIFGGRVSRGVPNLYRLGISYLKEKNDSSNFREETGIDLWFLPFSKVEISGRSGYNFKDSGWAEHAYYLTLGPFNNLRLSSEVSWIKYENYFTSVTTGAFLLQSGIIDPGETALILGGQAEYPVLDNIALSADYRNYNYDIAGNADYYGGRLSYSGPDSRGAGLALHRMAGETDALRYYESRAYAFMKFGAADVTLDVLNVTYDREINGVKNAYSVSLAPGYNLGQNSRASADIEYSHNPDFDSNTKVFVKFIHKFDFKGGSKS